MFEIIMLFAFLAAATSQMLPSDSPRGKLLWRLKKHLGGKGFALWKPFQKQLGQPGNSKVSKNRSTTCAAA